MKTLFRCSGGHEWEWPQANVTLSPGATLPCPICGAMGSLCPEATEAPSAVVGAPAADSAAPYETLMLVLSESDVPRGAEPAAVLPERVTLPGYEVLRELGRGGMGVVYKARQTRLNRVVALKMVLSGGHASSDDLVRFLNEAEAVARMQHPNIVQIFETGHHEGLPYFTLEFVDGGSLSTRLDGTPLPP